MNYKALALALALLFVCAPMTGALAQTKKSVAEECTQDADCETGNCILLKTKNRKECLYCRASDYETYLGGVQDKCKELDEIAHFEDLKAWWNKSTNKRDEWSLQWLNFRRGLNVDCVKARTLRENNCFKDKIDKDHEEQIQRAKNTLNAIDDMIKDSIRNGKAYKVDREHFDHLTEDEKQDCKDLRADFDWLSSLKEDKEKADCSRISSVVHNAMDCKQVRKEIVDVFEDHASSQRTNALKEAEAAQSEAERMLDIKKSKNLCR